MFSTPECDEREFEFEVLDRIDGLRRDLRFQVAELRRWTGSCKR